MKNHYSILKLKANRVLLFMILFVGVLTKGQSLSPIEIAEAKKDNIKAIIYERLQQKTGMSNDESSEFVEFYVDTIAKYVHRSLIYIRKHPNINVGDIVVQNYISRMVNHYAALYNDLKKIKTEFPSSVAEVLAPKKFYKPAGTCNAACDNVDFSSGTLSAWTVGYASCSSEDVATCPPPNNNTPPNFSYTTPTYSVPGNVNVGALDASTGNTNQVSTCGPGTTNIGPTDAIGGFPVVCPGYTYSCMIGDGQNPNQGVAFLEQTFMVTPANVDFYYNYAVCLENPAHCFHMQPYFNVTMLDQNNDTIPHCGNYNVVAGGSNVNGTWKNNGDWEYLPWTTAFVSLRHYLGQCVTVIIQTSDCGAGAHAGYAYFDASCKTLGIITSAPALCGNPITLTAPKGGLTYQWSAPAGGCMTPAAGNVPTITVSCPGKYTVVITTVSGSLCADTLDTIITSSTATAPIPNFKADTVCAGNPTTFTNLTTGGNPASNVYTWTFSAGNTSSSAGPVTFTYPAAGNYTATLQATSGGCGGDTTKTVVVVGPPTAAFTASTVCLNTPTVFTNTSTPATGPFSWNFGDGSAANTTQNPTHTYAACGTYKVVLTVGIKGCIAKDSINVTVNPNPVPSFVTDTVCIGGSTQFTDKTTIACGGSITGWSWKFGDPPTNGTSAVQNPTYSYNPATTPATYNVTLTSTSNNGCQTAVTLPVEVVGKPTVAFTVAPVCVGQTANFVNTSTGATTWKWTFGDPANGTSAVKNPSYTYATAGTYTIKLVASTGAGCIDSTTNTITVNPSPVGAATASTVCQGAGTVFTNTTTGASSYKWSFGDAPTNGTSVATSPTYTYATAGNYTATLISTSANGCTDTIKVPVVVNPNPTGTFTVPTVCLGTASVFTLTPTNMAGGTYAWTFGDGVGTSAVQNPTYTYTSAGVFNVSVALTSSAGCAGTATGTAAVSSIPVANFIAPAVCQDQAMKFTDQSTVIGGKDTAWLWNFGDGHTSTVQSPTHQYAACGTYNVMLTVTSNAKCVHDTTIPVTIYAVPIPSFTATSVCQGLVTNFTDKSTIGCAATNTIAGWSWNFGDGSAPNTTQNPTHTYGAAGIYQVSLTVTSSTGCDSTVKLPVTVYPIPVPAFTANAPCFGTATNFTDQSTVAGGTIQGWAWSFGDPANSTSGTQNPLFTYPAAGTYNVRLIVTSNHGCIDSITKPVIVNPIPVPLFVSDTVGCTTLCIQDTDKSTVAGAPSNYINNWLWNFGDGSPDSSSVQPAPKHCYTQPGTYTVSLTVTTNNGCTATQVRPNYITSWPVPVAKFNASPNPTVLVNNPTVVFTDQSTGSPVAWTWTTFGDPADSVKFTENTTHTYTDTGTFYVQLDIVNKYGCKDSIIEPVVVQPIWTFYVPNAFTPNGDGINEGFIGKGIGILSYEMWIFDRWGMQLYHCTDMQHPWNGTVQGTSGVECQEDTYVWLIQIVDVFHGSHRYVGKVTIIK